MKYNKIISAEELEKIERFVTNDMDKSEADAFSLAMSADEELREKTQEVKLLLLGIKEASLEKQLRGTDKNFPEQKKGKLTQLHVKWWLVAASIVVVAAFGTWFLLLNKENDKKLYSKYYTPDPGLATVMSVSSNYDFEKAMVEYKNGGYAKALRAWTDLLKQKPGNDTLIYFIAAASQAMGNEDLAIENLQQVIADNSSAFYKDACWYLGLGYLKKGETNQAIKYIGLSGYPQAPEIIKAITTRK